MSSGDRDLNSWFNSDHHSYWPSPTFDLNNKNMFAALGALSGVILVILALYIYARCGLRRRRQAFRGLPVIFRHPFQIPKRGLDPTVIASLPTFTVRAIDGLPSSATECAVCLSVLKEQDTARKLPNCKHVFHVDCVDKWLTTCSTCPICRTEVEPRPRLEPELREGPVGTTPPLEELMVEAAASSSSDNKTLVSPASRLNSFRRILTRERSSYTINHSYTDQDSVADLERQ